jgi:hypothetical protein
MAVEENEKIKEKLEDRDIVLDIENLSSELKNVSNNLAKKISEITAVIKGLDDRIKWIQDEINHLEMKRKEAVSKGNYTYAEKLNRAIISRTEILKRLYESRADTEQTLQSYYKLLIESNLKGSELKVKVWERFKKSNTDTDTDKLLIKRLVNELLKQTTNQQQNDDVLLMESSDSQKNKNKKKREEILEEDEDILPNEFKI